MIIKIQSNWMNLLIQYNSPTLAVIVFKEKMTGITSDFHRMYNISGKDLKFWFYFCSGFILGHTVHSQRQVILCLRVSVESP